MNVLELILQWSVERPMWQRDALRRLLHHQGLTPDDVDALARICKQEHGLNESAPVPLPLSNSDVAVTGAAGVPVRITAVRNVQHVNALAPGRALGFGAAGLTVVYGDNGSGKSGYTRILRNICRARGGAPKIHPNIFQAPEAVTPSATIDYVVGDQERTVTWQEHLVGLSELADVTVFDSACASVYVEEKTNVVYRPFGLDLFPKLVSACEQVKGRLQTDLSALGPARSFPDLQRENPAGNLIRGLGAKTATAALDRLSTLKDDEIQRLEVLRAAVAELDREDPAARAAELSLRLQRFKTMVAHAAQVEKVLAEAAANALRDSAEAKRVTAEAARLASGEAFVQEPLGAIGSTAWKVLWDAARHYSEGEAYRNNPFPVTDGGARCVLCQQALGDEGSERLRRFADFVRAEAQLAANTAAVAFDALYKPFATLAVVRESDENLLAEMFAQDAAFGETLRDYLTLMQRRLDQLRAAYGSADWSNITPVGASPCARLLQIIASIEGTAAALKSAGVPEEANRIRREFAELLDREKLLQVKQEVLTEIERQRVAALLKACLKQTETAGITTKNTELTKLAVSETLRDRFEHELHELDLRHLTVSVRPQHGAKGVMFHQVEFHTAQTGGWGVREVLSEGEHRCIALAAFWAELSMQQTASAVILDDPVSSLDHNRRESVACRLVREAKNRPVVVLTHDIVFLLFLQEQAKEHQVPFTGRFLEREKGMLGVPVDGLPWTGLPLTKRVGWLRQEAVRLKTVYNDEGSGIYDKESAYLWGRLREAWECGVEEVLLNGAIKRFSRKVSTQPLGIVHDITEQDVQTVEAGMTACSTWLHDQAAAINTSMPAPAVFVDAVENLEAWRASIVNRRAAAKKPKKAG